MNLLKIKNKRKGQVFLLLAIVILIYLIFLASTVYRISQSQFVNPTANQENLLNYVENTIDNVYGLAEVGVAAYSHGSDRPTITTIIENGLVTIEDFLTQHGLSANLELLSEVSVYNSSTSANPALIHIQFNISIFIDSPELYYSAEFTIDLTYYLEISGTTGTENYIYITKIQSGTTSVISDAIITIVPNKEITNLGDGSYKVDLEAGDMITAQLPNNILLWKEV